MAQDLKNLRRTAGKMSGHILPDTNSTYDIGSAEYKIRDMYVSDSSLWIGDDHQVAIDPQGCYFCMESFASGNVLDDGGTPILDKQTCIENNGYWLLNSAYLNEIDCEAETGGKWKKKHMKSKKNKNTKNPLGLAIHSFSTSGDFTILQGLLESADADDYKEFNNTFKNVTTGTRIELKNSTNQVVEFDFVSFTLNIDNVTRSEAKLYQTSSGIGFNSHTLGDRYLIWQHEELIVSEEPDGKVPQNKLSPPEGGKFIEGELPPLQHKHGTVGETKVGHHAGHWFLYVCVAPNMWGRTPLEVGWPQTSHHVPGGESKVYHIHVTNEANTAYIIDGVCRTGHLHGPNPIITIDEDDTLHFHINAAGHPFHVKNSSAVDVITDSGVNGADTGEIVWKPTSSPTEAGTYTYVCGVHPAMTNSILVQPKP